MFTKKLTDPIEVYSNMRCLFNKHNEKSYIGINAMSSMKRIVLATAQIIPRKSFSKDISRVFITKVSKEFRYRHKIQN